MTKPDGSLLDTCSKILSVQKDVRFRMQQVHLGMTGKRLLQRAAVAASTSGYPVCPTLQEDLMLFKDLWRAEGRAMSSQ